MKREGFLFVVFIFFLASCKPGKKNNSGDDFFPATPFIQSDVTDVDTSVYPIMKIEWADDQPADTTFVRREEFRELARDFLSLPDLSEKKYKKRFTETAFFDETLNTAVFTYIPIHPDKEEIQRLEIHVVPQAGGDKVKRIVIDRFITPEGRLIQQRMLWQIGKSFQIATLTGKPGTDEKVHTLKIIWNDDGEF